MHFVNKNIVLNWSYRFLVLSNYTNFFTDNQRRLFVILFSDRVSHLYKPNLSDSNHIIFMFMSLRKIV